MSKWYAGLEAHEINYYMQGVANDVVTLFADGKESESDKAEKYFDKEYEELIAALCETRTAYYLLNDAVYKYWTECIEGLRTTRREMQENIYQVYLEREAMGVMNNG